MDERTEDSTDGWGRQLLLSTHGMHSSDSKLVEIFDLAVCQRHVNAFQKLKATLPLTSEVVNQFGTLTETHKARDAMISGARVSPR